MVPTMSDLDGIRRDVAKLASDLSRGVSATSVLIEQIQKQLNEVARRLDEKVREDHQGALKLAADLAEIKTKLDGLRTDADHLSGTPERIAKLEAGHEHVRADITGKHDMAKDLAKVTVESHEKKEDRLLEEKKIKAEQHKAKLQFWGAVAVVSLPGIIALLWHLFGLPGSPPTTPSAPRPPTHSAAEPH